jgi:hypothetical protein
MYRARFLGLHFAIDISWIKEMQKEVIIVRRGKLGWLQSVKRPGKKKTTGCLHEITANEVTILPLQAVK